MRIIWWQKSLDTLCNWRDAHQCDDVIGRQLPRSFRVTFVLDPTVRPPVCTPPTSLASCDLCWIGSRGVVVNNGCKNATSQYNAFSSLQTMCSNTVRKLCSDVKFVTRKWTRMHCRFMRASEQAVGERVIDHWVECVTLDGSRVRYPMTQVWSWNYSNVGSSRCNVYHLLITGDWTAEYVFPGTCVQTMSIVPERDNYLSLIHIWRCRRSTLCRSRWSPYH